MSQKEYEVYKLEDFIKKYYIWTPDNINYNRILNLTNKLKIFDIDNGCWIAGGSVLSFILNNGTSTQDIDIFINKDISVDKIIEKYHSIPSEQKNIYNKYYSHNATTIQTEMFGTIQIINKDSYSNPKDLINSFDFTICQWITDGKYIMFPLIAMEDLRLQRLHHITTRKEISSITRFSKYISKGFSPTVDTVKTMLEWYQEDDGFFKKYGY